MTRITIACLDAAGAPLVLASVAGLPAHLIRSPLA
jgi:hypothetical protein